MIYCCLGLITGVLFNRYAKDLVNILFSEDGPDFGAASDGISSFTQSIS